MPPARRRPIVLTVVVTTAVGPEPTRVAVQGPPPVTSEQAAQAWARAEVDLGCCGGRCAGQQTSSPR